MGKLSIVDLHLPCLITGGNGGFKKMLFFFLFLLYMVTANCASIWSSLIEIKTIKHPTPACCGNSRFGR